MSEIRRYAVALSHGQLELVKVALAEHRLRLNPALRATGQRLAETTAALLRAQLLPTEAELLSMDHRALELAALSLAADLGVGAALESRFVESGPPRTKAVKS